MEKFKPLTKSEIQSMLFEGMTFKMTTDIERYKDWHFGCKWTDAIIGEDPEWNNRGNQCRMYVPKWRVLGFPDLDEITEQYNKGWWIKTDLPPTKIVHRGISVQEYNKK